MDIEKAARAIMDGENGAAIRRLAGSEAGAKLSARFDARTAEEAFRLGDEAQMRAVLQSVLGTPEGRELAAYVQKAVNGNGR